MQRYRVILIIIIIAMSIAGAGAQAVSIDADKLRGHVEYLSSDEMLGRDTGQRGIELTEEYVAKTFKAYGLAPMPGQDGFFVDFDLYRRSYEVAKTTVDLRAAGKRFKGKVGLDFRPFPFSDPGVVKTEIVFAGYGITAEEYEYDDYDGLDVEGKFVFILRHEPREDDPESVFDGDSTTNHATFAAKRDQARERGAAGMILVTDPLNHEPGDDMRTGGSLDLEPPEDRDGEEAAKPFLAVHITREMAEMIGATSGKSLTDLQRAVDEGTRPAELALAKATARISIRWKKEAEIVPARNVVGFLEGSDPELKNEWILIGGHHDHVGGFVGDGDTVYNGADDNASGTSGVLELAQAFAAEEKRPRRSIVFATFSAEEKGLLGSRALVRQELIPIDPIVFMFNLDMIGRNSDKQIQVYGDGYSRELRELVDGSNSEIKLDLDYAGTGYAGNSDHDSFYQVDIPFMFFFTGVHEDYHQLGDHAEKLDYPRMASILELAHGVLSHLANADEPPGFIHHVNWLGLQVEVLAGDAGAEAVVTGVEEESRAVEAGFATGDVLVAFDGEELTDAEAVGAEFRAIDPGTEVALMLDRGGERVELTVERAKTGYMGVFPGPVDEDQRQQYGLGPDEGMLLRRVTADGPSAAAGLQEGDIVIRMNGQPVGVENLRSRLSQIGAGETIDIVLIRDGERMTLPMELGERPSR